LALRRVGPPIFLRDRERDTKKSRSQSHGSVLRFPSSRRPVVRPVSFAGAQRAKKKRTRTQSFPSHPSHPSSHSSSSSRRRSSPVVSRVVSLASGIFSRAAARVSSSVSRVAPASRPRVTTTTPGPTGASQPSVGLEDVFSFYMV